MLFQATTTVMFILLLWVVLSQTDMDYMTWLGMFGNGVLTVMTRPIIVSHRSQIQ